MRSFFSPGAGTRHQAVTDGITQNHDELVPFVSRPPGSSWVPARRSSGALPVPVVQLFSHSSLEMPA